MQTTSNKTNMLNLERQLKSADTYVLNNNNKNKNTQRQKKKLVKHKTVTIHARTHMRNTRVCCSLAGYAQIYSSVWNTCKIFCCKLSAQLGFSAHTHAHNEKIWNIHIGRSVLISLAVSFFITPNEWHHFMNGNGNDSEKNIHNKTIIIISELNLYASTLNRHHTYDDRASVSRNSAFAVKTCFFISFYKFWNRKQIYFKPNCKIESH